MTQGILSGVRVLDLARHIAGPIAAQHLLENGAQVIRIEPPGGDPEQNAPGFAVWNRGKSRLALDWTSAAGRARLDVLLGEADVLIHDLTPNRARAAGLNDPSLQARHPGLIAASVTGWPANHADAERPPRETLVMARLGLLAEQPGHRDGPIFVAMPFASFCAAWLCAIGIIARLIQRGRGRGVGAAHTSLAQGALIPMTMHWARASTPSPSFAKGLNKSVAVAIHQCADGGWIHVHYSPDKAPWMQAALQAMGPEKVAAANARWGQNHTAPNFGANREIFATRPAGEWLDHLWAHDVAAQPAAAFGSIYFDEQARENGYIVPLHDPQYGATLQPGPAYGVRPQARLRGPLQPLTDDKQFSGSRIPVTVGEPVGLPLDGIRVIDFGAHIAGPFGPMLLSDLGADIIKVEPVAGEKMRYLDRAFCGAQRGKRGVALQLNDPASRAAVAALIGSADAFHHNIRIPSARKLGIDNETLRAVNPSIIGCHVSSYGPVGARKDWPGFDQMFQASCGWEVENGGAGNAPMWLRFGVTDHLASLASIYALLLALYHRDRTGNAQMVTASLLGATIQTTSITLVHPDHSLEPYDRLDSGQMGVANTHRLYQCADGMIAVAAFGTTETNAFTQIAGDNPESFFAGRKAKAVLDALQIAGVPAEFVRENQADAFLESPTNRDAGLIAQYHQAVNGDMEQIGAFWTLGDRPCRMNLAPPGIGEHSRQVLLSVGISPDDYAKLLQTGIAGGR